MINTLNRRAIRYMAYLAKDKMGLMSYDDIVFFTETLDRIIKNSDLIQTDEFMQHRGTSRFLHSVAVSYYSYALSKILHIHCDMAEMLTGALLHDYYLYDWRDIENHKKAHAQVHPEAAVANAERSFDLTDKEKDIIKFHMFPITPIPPQYKESVIVCIVDKFCAVYEVLARKNGKYKAMRRRMYARTSMS